MRGRGQSRLSTLADAAAPLVATPPSPSMCPKSQNRSLSCASLSSATPCDSRPHSSTRAAGMARRTDCMHALQSHVRLAATCMPCLSLSRSRCHHFVPYWREDPIRIFLGLGNIGDCNRWCSRMCSLCAAGALCAVQEVGIGAALKGLGLVQQCLGVV